MYLHNLQGYGHGRRRRGAGGVKHLRNLNLNVLYLYLAFVFCRAVSINHDLISQTRSPFIQGGADTGAPKPLVEEVRKKAPVETQVNEVEKARFEKVKMAPVGKVEKAKKARVEKVNEVQKDPVEVKAQGWGY
jgi:hypothetical protein